MQQTHSSRVRDGTCAISCMSKGFFSLESSYFGQKLTIAYRR